MKLLGVIIFVAAISIISSSPSRPPIVRSFPPVTSTTSTTTVDPSMYSCPEGYKKYRKTCYKAREPDFRCPSVEAKKDGDYCVISHKYCPTGYNLRHDGEACEIVGIAPRAAHQCDKNFIYDSEQGFCVKEISRNKAYRMCGPWYELEDDRCVAYPEPAHEVCPEGDDDSNFPDGCQSRRKRKIGGFCDPGYEIDPNNKNWCEFNPNYPTIYCLPGSDLDLDTKTCSVAVKVRAPLDFCEAGDSLDPPDPNVLEELSLVQGKPNMIKEFRKLSEKESHSRNYQFHHQDKGDCIESEAKPAKCSCYQDPRSVNRNVGKFKNPNKPIVVCLEGTMKEGVCQATRSVKPFLGCPRTFFYDNVHNYCYNFAGIPAKFTNTTITVK